MHRTRFQKIKTKIRLQFLWDFDGQWEGRSAANRKHSGLLEVFR
jgi:hypothetical protein